MTDIWRCDVVGFKRATQPSKIPTQRRTEREQHQANVSGTYHQLDQTLPTSAENRNRGHLRGNVEMVQHLSFRTENRNEDSTESRGAQEYFDGGMLCT